MDNYEYNELIKKLAIKIENIEKIINPKKLENRIKEIEKLESSQEFWSDAKKAGVLQKEKNSSKSMLAKFNEAKNALNDAIELLEMANEEKDEETKETLYEDAPKLEEFITKLEVNMMLSGKDDDKNAILSIHPGAGGTESQDWANMVYRMYLRWAERENLKVEVLDYQVAEEAGIKDVSFIIKGENAYGYLKVENGIHRLVRISPFDSNAKRHTSFL